MAKSTYTIKDAHGNQVQVDLKRDKRLKKSSRWERQPGGSILLRVPYRLPKFRIGSLINQVASQLEKAGKKRTHHSDSQLHARAEAINRQLFGGKIQWNAIRWVSNMQARLGSCTQGGATDGQIRISERIKNWPDWVVDYVIAHELMHRRHPGHTKEFWDELKTAFPLTEQARGFIKGVDFARGLPAEEE